MPLPPHLHALLGTVPDPEIAAQAGVTAARICQIRGEAGIAPAPRRDVGGRVTVTFTAEEWSRIVAYAEANGTTASGAVRMLTLRPIGAAG